MTEKEQYDLALYTDVGYPAASFDPAKCYLYFLIALGIFAFVGSLAVWIFVR